MQEERIFHKLTQKNYQNYCLYHYENSSCLNEEEFKEDLKAARSVKRILKRQRKGETYNPRLILNYIILLSNVFGVLPAIRILFFNVEPSEYHLLIEYLRELSYLSNYNMKVLSKYDGVEFQSLL